MYVINTMESVRRLLMSSVLLFLCLCMEAQEWVNLTAKEVQIDSLLPVYTYAKNLGRNYADSVYTVSIVYPEFIDMSEADISRYEALSDEIPGALPKITQHIGVNRKQGVLDISFVPIVMRDGKYQKLVSFMLKVQAEAKPLQARTRAAAVSASDRYAAHSVLREGSWAKIRVPESGVYQLTNSLIRQCGFSDISKVKVYGYGGALQPESLTGDYLVSTDDLKEVPVCIVGDKRLFYAVGPVTWESPTSTTRIRNNYSDYGYYFLTENDNEPQTLSAEDFKAAYYPSNNDYHTLYEVENYAWFHGGRNLFDQSLYVIGTPKTYTLSGNGSNGTLSVVLSYDGSFAATIAVNDSIIGNIQTNVSLNQYSKAESQQWEYQLKGLVSSQNTIKITQTSGGNLRLDYLVLTCTEPAAWSDLATTTFPTPDYVYRITNQDHHADTAVDMVIIIPTSQKWLSEAERIKTLHESKDNLSVRIVPADELYNEFSSGTPDANAYRRYLKMFYDRAQSDAEISRYLLLFGDGAWDNRMLISDWSGSNPDDFLLCYESENSFSEINCYVSDDYFCLLDDEEMIQQGSARNPTYQGKPDVAVGRFSARTLDQAKTLVDKTVSYANNAYAGAWQNTLCFMGDDGNNNAHMVTADKVATMVQNNYPSYIIKKIYWDAYTRTTSSTGNSYPDVTSLIKSQMHEGALMMNYCGHGAAYAISHEFVLKLADFEETTSLRLPLWITASCDIMPFDGQEDNIGESAMMNTKGGAVAFFGTTRTVYANYNEAMNLAFTKYVLGSTDGVRNTIGEAARLAKCDLVNNRSDLTPNKLQYTLLGDPALILATPTQDVVIDEINGQPLSAGSATNLPAGSVVKVTGHVVSAQTVDSSFNGVVTATVRDAEETITCKLNDTSETDEAFQYKDRTKTLYNGSDSVRSGSFTLTFAVPKDISYTDGSGLMTFYAVNNQKTLSAHGENSNVVFNGSSDASTDTTGPSIYCYLNSSSFTNGGAVHTKPYFVAELYDDDGINASGSSIGHDLELIIDGELSRTYNLNSYFTFDFGDYRRGKLGFNIPELTYGKHQLLFRAWDILNNSSTAILDFEVVKGLEPNCLSVSCTRNPASSTTTFIITHDRAGSDLDVQLDIFDTAGRQLWKYQESGTSTGDTYTFDWDLCVDGGRRLQTGVYLFRVSISSDGSSQSSLAKKLIIVGK